jgi:hypothetical protein
MIAAFLIIAEALFHRLGRIKIITVAFILGLFFTLLSGLAIENLGPMVIENHIYDNEIFDYIMPGGWKWQGGLPFRWYYIYGLPLPFPSGNFKFFYLNLTLDITFWFCISLVGFWLSGQVRSKSKRG